MKHILRSITCFLFLTMLLLCGTSCRSSSGNDSEVGESRDTAPAGTDTAAPVDSDTEGETTPPPATLPDESAILASAAEAWRLSDGGTGGTARSAIGGTDATHRWGVWLKNSTFGYALDFSTEGSYALAANSKFKPGEQFAISAWVKAPARENGERVIVSQGTPSETKYGSIMAFDNMDIKGRWGSSGNLTAVTQDAPEGRGYFMTSLANEGVLSISKRIAPDLDISGYTDGGYLHMWIRIDGLEHVTGGQIEFSSSRQSDRNEFQMNAVCVKEDGVWTEVYLPLSNNGGDTGIADLTALNYFRLYLITTGPVTLMIDDMYFCKRVREPLSEGWEMFINEAGELEFSAAGMEGLASGGCKINDGLWHHTLVSSDGSTLTYFVDGKAVKSLAVSGAPTTQSTDLYMGSSASGDRHLDGSLAEVRVFDAAKTPGEVTVTALDPTDNEAKQPVMDMKQGIVLDRRQYSGSDVRELEPDAVVGYEDITAIINMGFDHVKLLLTPNHLIAEDGSLKEEEMEYITWVIGNVLEQDFRVLLCIHPESPFKETYLANLDRFELLCKWYGELAAYIGERWTPAEVSLQLMTEPFSNSSEVTWSWMSDRMWGAVRNVLPEHTILTSSVGGNFENLKFMSPATDDNLIYTFTSYDPWTIGFSTFITPSLSMWAYIKDVPYPIEEGVDYTEIIEHCIEDAPDKDQARTWLTNYVKGISDGDRVNPYDSLYNAEWHMLRVKSLDDWRQRYGGSIHIMCVEFGCMAPEWPIAVYGAKVNGISAESRYQMIRDVRASFEAYDIGWSYWSYNEAFSIFLPEYALALRGTFPDAATIRKVVDYRILKECLGVTPKLDYERPAHLDDAIGAWELDETAGDTASALLPLTPDGTYHGTASEAYGDGHAAVFDGKSSYISVGNTGFALGGAFAIAADIKTSGTGTVQTILSQIEDRNELYTIDSFDTVNGMWGMTPVTQGTLTQPAEGTGYAESSDGELIVFCRVWNTPHDLSAYATSGILHISVYVEDAAKLRGDCMLELNSTEGTTSWRLPALTTGWNRIEVSIADFASNAADLSAISSFRVYQYVTGKTTLGIDALAVGFGADAVVESEWALVLDEQGRLAFVSSKLSFTSPVTTALNDGKWHKVLVSYDGATLSYYADGKLLASTPASGLQDGASGASDLFIGARGSNTALWTGSIAHVTLYDTVKTPDEARP